nr:PREDICTED: caspase-8 isoform X2 [Tribolium castaneum]|eukprot:XP_015835366.1 PREDICTED: caspase-8 isoform X2 [Tribolium castaneum]
MGGLFSSQGNDYSDDSCSEEESNEVSCKNQPTFDEDNCLDSTDTIDASLSQPAMPITLNVDQVMSIENDLDDYEKVALVFLIYEDPKSAFVQLTKLLQGSHDKLLYNWAIHENLAGRKWQEKLVEALCIIQNYQIISSLGFKREDLTARFLPHHIFTYAYVNKVRKALYFVCEALQQKDVENLLNLACKDFREKGLDFKCINAQFLELYLLHWETVGYVKLDDLSNLCRVLKQIDQLDICDKLREIVPIVHKSAESRSVDKRVDSSESEKRQSVSVFEGILDPKSSLLSLASLETSHISADNAAFVSDENKYFIDPERPGICLIINQENFYREVDRKYRHLLPRRDNKLELRIGTQYDRDKLEATFRQFGFKTIVENNLTHLEMLRKIEEVVQSVNDESSLFISIMSHGDVGVVYGVNSCQVDVKAIKRVMCTKNRPHLSGKPKVLILQSCQGTRCQKIQSDDDDIETDGPSSPVQESVPPIADLFTFWATVPGYGAIRNKKTGSWFIQSLCGKMKELGHKYHFDDICTSVIGDVSRKKWCQEKDEVAMVPEKESTFRKLFYLPPVRVW